MKLSNFLIKYGLILTLVCLVFLLILQPFNYREYKKSEEKVKEYNYRINNIILKVNYAEVNIKESDDDKIKIAYYDEKGSTLNQVYDKGDLNISLKNPFKIGANTMYPFTLYLPKDNKLEVDFILSVGNIIVDKINVKKLVVDQGIGNFSIKDSIFNDGEIFQSIGKMQLNKLKSDNILIDSDIGHVILNGIDSKDNFSLKKSVGKANIKEVYAPRIKAKAYIGKIDYMNIKNFNYEDIFVDVPLGHNKNNVVKKEGN